MGVLKKEISGEVSPFPLPKKKKWKLTNLYINLSLKEPYQQPFDLLVLITLHLNTFFLLALIVPSFSIGLCYTVLRFSHCIFVKIICRELSGKEKNNQLRQIRVQ